MLKLTSFLRKCLRAAKESVLLLTFLTCSLVFVGCSDLIEFVKNQFSSEEAPETTFITNFSQVTLTSLPQKSAPFSPLLDWDFTDKNRNTLVTVHQSGEILLWNLDQGKAYLWWSTKMPMDLAMVLPARGIVALSHREDISVIDIFKRKKIRALTRLKIRPTEMEMDDSGDALIIGGSDGRIYRWKFKQEIEAPSTRQKERALERYVGHASVISALAVHPFGRVFFSGDWRGLVNAWIPLDSDQYQGEFDVSLFGSRAYTDQSVSVSQNIEGKGGVAHLIVSQDGEYVIVAGERGHLEVWSVRGFTRVASSDAHEGLIYSVAISTDNKRIASLGRDGALEVFELSDNPAYSAGSDLKRLVLKPFAKYSLPQARRVLFRDPSTLLVSTEDNELLEIAVEATNVSVLAGQPTPTPGAVPFSDDY